MTVSRILLCVFLLLLVGGCTPTPTTQSISRVTVRGRARYTSPNILAIGGSVVHPVRGAKIQLFRAVLSDSIPFGPYTCFPATNMDTSSLFIPPPDSGSYSLHTMYSDTSSATMHLVQIPHSGPGVTDSLGWFQCMIPEQGMHAIGISHPDYRSVITLFQNTRQDTVIFIDMKPVPVPQFPLLNSPQY